MAHPEATRSWRNRCRLHPGSKTCSPPCFLRANLRLQLHYRSKHGLQRAESRINCTLAANVQLHTNFPISRPATSPSSFLGSGLAVLALFLGSESVDSSTCITPESTCDNHSKKSVTQSPRRLAHKRNDTSHSMPATTTIDSEPHYQLSFGRLKDARSCLFSGGSPCTA